jgi:hypothetical protein
MSRHETLQPNSNPDAGPDMDTTQGYLALFIVCLSLLLSILCWSYCYCRVVALGYHAGLRYELSNLDAAASKAIQQAR